MNCIITKPNMTKADGHFAVWTMHPWAHMLFRFSPLTGALWPSAKIQLPSAQTQTLSEACSSLCFLSWDFRNESWDAGESGTELSADSLA